MKIQIPDNIIHEIYSMYGYEEAGRRSGAVVYVLQQGMYHGAEIVIIDEAIADEKLLKQEFSEAGYACKIRRFASVLDIENCLFDGFFNRPLLLSRVEQKYKSFANNQSRHLGKGFIYEYVASPFSISSDSITKEDNSILDIIKIVLTKPGAYFTIIEAAAGFGKTCTAYEILNNIPKLFDDKCPLFAELSNDRQAKIFKYVLLSAIDTEYRQSVPSDLVKHHIKSGRIPLIIDGFDELLSKEQDTGRTKVSDFDEVETMLSTIAELLQGNAKIILTSRKTAIFSGEEFSSWASAFTGSFSTLRIAIEKPRLNHWLSEEKLDLVNKNNIPLKHIANPVLLSYLRYLDNQSFADTIKSTDDIVNKYFNNLLEREKERQNLLLDVKLQLQVFKKLCASFADFNITSEQKSFVKELILSENISILQECSNFYPLAEKPTVDELAEKLSNHAFMDRISSKKDSIGFVNEFIFGMFLGNVIIDKFINSERVDFNENILDLAIQAYQYHSISSRLDLWNALNDCVKGSTFKLQLDSRLRDEVLNNYSTEYFEGITFENVSFLDKCFFKESYFAECKFENCVFDFSRFDEVGFQNCLFNNCINASDSSLNAPLNISLFGCNDYQSGFLDTIKIANYLASIDLEGFQETDRDRLAEYSILKMYYKVGTRQRQMRLVTKVKSEISSIKELAMSDSSIIKELKRLSDKGYIILNGNKSFVTSEGSSYFFNEYFSN